MVSLFPESVCERNVENAGCSWVSSRPGLVQKDVVEEAKTFSQHIAKSIHLSRMHPFNLHVTLGFFLWRCHWPSLCSVRETLRMRRGLSWTDMATSGFTDIPISAIRQGNRREIFFVSLGIATAHRFRGKVAGRWTCELLNYWIFNIAFKSCIYLSPILLVAVLWKSRWLRTTSCTLAFNAWHTSAWPMDSLEL